VWKESRSLRAYCFVPLQPKGSFTLYVTTQRENGPLANQRNIVECFLTSYRHRPSATAAGRRSGKSVLKCRCPSVSKRPLYVVDSKSAMRSLMGAGRCEYLNELSVRWWSVPLSVSGPYVGQPASEGFHVITPTNIRVNSRITRPEFPNLIWLRTHSQSKKIRNP
jgi:hypothetical protein